ADRNRSHWSTSKTPSYTKSVSWQHYPVYALNINFNTACLLLIKAVIINTAFYLKQHTKITIQYFILLSKKLIIK
ncbi:hypothetical protein, partial [Escherichia coli]|uniref:hypothetical protein n=1 Tax=Escherichia coli TaxID=562 RepID=UPI001FF19702